MVRHTMDCIAIAWKGDTWKKRSRTGATGRRRGLTETSEANLWFWMENMKSGSQAQVWSKTVMPHGQFWGPWSSGDESRTLSKPVMGKICYLTKGTKRTVCLSQELSESLHELNVEPHLPGTLFSSALRCLYSWYAAPKTVLKVRCCYLLLQPSVEL